MKGRNGNINGNKKIVKSKQHEGGISPLQGDHHHLQEYWSKQIVEARATIARALNIEGEAQKEGLLSPSFINDPLLLLEYWAARSGEARARMEERLALASLSANMDRSLKESGDMLKRLEAALEHSPKAKDSLMNGRLF